MNQEEIDLIIDLINELDENVNLDLNNKYEKDFSLLRSRVRRLLEA